MLHKRLLPAALALCCNCASQGLPAASGPVIQLQRELALHGVIVEFPKPGRVTLIDFWATSCEPCKAMMPSLQKLWVENRAAGLDVVGIASDDNPGLVAEYVKSLGVSYPQVVDANAAIRGGFHVAQLPYTLVIDRDARVRLSLQGGKPEDVQRIVSATKAALEE